MTTDYQGTYDTSASNFNQLKQQITQRLTEWQTSNDKLIDDVEHRLKGERWDLEKQKYIKKNESYLNNEGVNQLMDFFAPRVDKNIILSEFSPETVEKLTRKADHDLICSLVLHCEEWGMNTTNRSWKDNLNYIRSLIMPHVFATYKRAEAPNTERKMIEKMATTVEKVVTGGQQEKSDNAFTFPGSLFGGKK